MHAPHVTRVSPPYSWFTDSEPNVNTQRRNRQQGEHKHYPKRELFRFNLAAAHAKFHPYHRRFAIFPASVPP